MGYFQQILTLECINITMNYFYKKAINNRFKSFLYKLKRIIKGRLLLFYYCH